MSLATDPWPIWEDGFINSYKWMDHRSKGFLLGPDSPAPSFPPNIPVAYWKRPNYENISIEWCLASEETPLDLVKHNGHLMKYNIMASISSSIQSLEELGRTKPFEPDYQGPNYQNNGGFHWKPWHHIYSSKAGKGTVHTLRLNKSGLYFVRLFYMGHWRRFEVDDYLPFNENDELLLPCSQNKFNLWPFLLTKAILQVASLSWGPFGEAKDFSVTSCLTGWTLFVVNCRNMNIEDTWKVVQMNLVENKSKVVYPKFCLSRPCCGGDKIPPFCSYVSNSPTIFAVVSKTNHEIKKISPAEEHIMCIMYADVSITDDVNKLPPWKKMRWIDWARSNGGMKETLGIINYTVQVYSPYRKFSRPDPYFVENIRAVVKDVIAKKITTGHMKDLLIAEALKDFEDTETQFLNYDFSTLYPFVRELHVFYKSSQFKYVQQITNLDMFSSAIPATENWQKKLGQLTENYNLKCFFLYSDSKFCKDFFVTLSVFMNDSENFRPYLMCEEYSWKSQVHGQVLFDQSTHSSVTHLLQLKSSVQVCRFWHCLPSHYHFSIRGNTPFELLDEEGLQQKLSVFSEVCWAFGEKMTEAYRNISPAILNSPESRKLINDYKMTFYPPLFSSFPEDVKININADFDEVFDECLTEAICEELAVIPLSVLCLEAHKMLYNNEKNVDKMLNELLNYEEKAEFFAAEEYLMMKQRHNYADLMVKELTKFKKDRDIEGPVEFRKSFTATSLPPSNASTSDLSVKKKSFSMKVGDSAILNSPLLNLKLLRKILRRKSKYLELYPFKNEIESMLAFHDYYGSTEVIPKQNWFLITRLILNVHSYEPVPCHIKVKTNLNKATMVLFDLESSNFITPSFAINRTFYLRRSDTGYALLLYSTPTENMINKPITIKWNIRVAGIEMVNILHPCYKSPLFPLKTFPHEVPDIFTQSISGFYSPNSEYIIGRFQIKSTSSPLVTLYASIARSDVWIRVVIRGGDLEVCAAEGKGSVLVPALLLDKANAVTFTVNDVETYIFKGEIQLIDNWVLNEEEKLFFQMLGEVPEKDITSLEDFQDYRVQVPLEPNRGEEDAVEEIVVQEVRESKAEKETFEIMEKKNSEFSEEIEIADDYTFFTEREFKEPIFGLATFAPYWRVSMMIDTIDKDDTNLLYDDQKFKEFEMFKISWEENDPGRFKKGEELRNDFLKFGLQEILKMHLNQEELRFSDFSEDEREEGVRMYNSLLEGNQKVSRARRRGTRKRSSLSKKSVVSEEMFRTKDGANKIINRKISSENSPSLITEETLHHHGNSVYEFTHFKDYGELFSKPPSNMPLSSVYDYSYYTTDKYSLRVDSQSSSESKLVFDGTKQLFKSSKEDPLDAAHVTMAASSELPLSPENSEDTLGQLVSIKEKTSEMPAKATTVPSVCLLVDPIPYSKSSPVLDLYIRGNKSANLLADMTITEQLIKKYALTCDHTEARLFDPEEFLLDFETPRMSVLEGIVREGIKELVKADMDINILLDDVIDPALYPFTKRHIPRELFIVPEKVRVRCDIVKTIEGQYQQNKEEAEKLLSQILSRFLKLRKSQVLQLPCLKTDISAKN